MDRRFLWLSLFILISASGQSLEVSSNVEEQPLPSDEVHRLIVHQNAFLAGKNGRYGYLAVEPVKKGSYQYAFFGQRDYFPPNTISDRTSKFTLVINPDLTYSIECTNGEKSYLALKRVNKSLIYQLSYQNAFFATKEYLEQGEYCSRFYLVRHNNGCYRIQSAEDKNIYLSFSALPQGSYQYAFFATEDYIKYYNYAYSFALNQQYQTELQRLK